jgi:peptidoglycan hydrolase CwlO-like protein
LTTTRRSIAARLRVVTALVIAASLASPAASAALPAQEAPPGTGGREADDAGRGGELAIDTDPMQADTADVDETLDSLTENVDEQLGQLESARAALREIDTSLASVRESIDETETKITGLEGQSDDVVVEAFMNPPTESSLDTLTADSLSDATVKMSILDTQADANADVLGDLADAREELEAQKADEAELEDAYEEARDASESELIDLQGAQSQQALFIAQVQERLDKNLSEAEALKGIDPELAASIEAREGEVATKVQEVRDAEATQRALETLALQQAQAEREAQEAAAAQAAADAPSTSGDVTVGAASGSLTSVACPTGGSITIDSSMASGLEGLLSAAAADGYPMCGGGYRDPAEQIALREANCGTSYYDIYEAPSSSCSPPTARPGTSNHEQGLAVDFTCDGSTMSSGMGCFGWMNDHANSYGFYNLPSEPWHWSNDGT